MRQRRRGYKRMASTSKVTARHCDTMFLTDRLTILRMQTFWITLLKYRDATRNTAAKLTRRREQERTKANEKYHQRASGQASARPARSRRLPPKPPAGSSRRRRNRSPPCPLPSPSSSNEASHNPEHHDAVLIPFDGFPVLDIKTKTERIT